MSILPLPNSILERLLARLAASENCVFLETSRPDGRNRSSYLFTDAAARLDLLPGDDPDAYLARLEGLRDEGHYLAGWFAYEFGYLLEPRLAVHLAGLAPDTPLASFGVYRQPLIYDHGRGEFTPDVEPEPAAADFFYRLGPHRFSESRERYCASIARIKQFIAAGDTYQVNYTLKMHFPFSGSPEGLYLDLRRRQSVGFGACIRLGGRVILSCSPELFFRIEDGVIIARPMKGTVRRGVQPADDERFAEFLRSDVKNRSENVMIVDLLRNDLGRVCRAGSVEVEELFAVEPYETLHQMTSTVRGELLQRRLIPLLRALFPCGSVTGAPKIRTMEIIRSLEGEPRGVYTGAIGFFAPGGDAVFNVPIRTVVLEGDRGEMGIGSGIVFDSDAEREWEECVLKGSFLVSPPRRYQLIETLLWRPDGGFWLLPLHLERLRASARFLGFAFDEERVGRCLRGAVATGKNAVEGGSDCLRLRLLLDKDGEMGCTATPCPAPVVAAAGGPVARVMLSRHATDSNDPLLYHKTTERGLYDRERRRAAARGCLDVLFVNERGELTEGAISNLFLLDRGVLYTPPVASGLLAGVLRRHLLAGGGPFPLAEKVLTPADLDGAEALFIGNSVRGLVRVEFAGELPETD
ncbi:MAG: aminodeoxychorismate synthase component I [Thermodesulfobacteriota bacterium]